MALTNAQRQARHRAKQELRYAPLTYLDTVLTALHSETGNPAEWLSQEEVRTVFAGLQYGIGPHDCAAQIIADRENGSDHD